MTTVVRLRLTLVGETMFPLRNPFFRVGGGTSRFPHTPLHTLIGHPKDGL
jgi:hypothetical protein